jgi:hypothetical protein
MVGRTRNLMLAIQYVVAGFSRGVRFPAKDLSWQMNGSGSQQKIHAAIFLSNSTNRRNLQSVGDGPLAEAEGRHFDDPRAIRKLSVICNFFRVRDLRQKA